MPNLTFNLEDLALEELSVTTMRDGVALPETGASACSAFTSIATSSSCCCIVIQ
ncbi:thiazolylpeptide-type bacteriocin [Nonomuraea sp. LP-02]|jgi:hypothetical protein|uniref:thiazolylpeptide-type bacteriocin n=1 Tax=Nonomuraea TaxID=83681 RepID=UPI002E3564A4|nr:thiazolylpeptide-type bacteriocin [Nonomuraea sp. LP-02]MED7925257.1 thiazolylpeptide-type bacteriocin [Nonomuraea sp. LP-02]